MRRDRRYFEGTPPRIEIIPMIDIMMFLLVFFMVITLNMIVGSGVALELPRMATAQQLPPAKITVGVGRDGVMVVEGQPLEAAELKARLVALRNQGPVEVVIAGDKGTELQHVIRVMDAVREAGIEAVAIAAQPAREGS